MIPAVAQALAQILTEGTSLQGTEQIDFNPPSRELAGKPVLTIYCYSLRESQQAAYDISVNQSSEVIEIDHSLITPRWFDVSFLISAWDHTALGEQWLLSEALRALLCHCWLNGNQLPSETQGRQLPLVISQTPEVEAVLLWQSLGLPLRPALYVTVTIPMGAQSELPPQEQALKIAC
ncbi:MAG: Pvc16 family protein [Leptolyngbyaceae cyanobacterium bins.59]|nr:Pvc16 family protein [Leptolyngbyaceae cyanobacterium bins.59]